MPLEFAGAGTPLTDGGFDGAAETLGVEAAKLWAVFEIESRLVGFLRDRRPVILFERHKFHEATGGAHSGGHPDISNAEAGGYGAGGSAQYDRLARAMALDRNAAIASTSWGLGQVMGFNHTLAGFATPGAMVEAMCGSEDAQLAGMVGLIKARKLDQALRTSNWAGFAKGYNGKGYAKHSYDTRLAAAHAKHRIGPLPDLEVRRAQLLLFYLGYKPGPVDGWLGPTTLLALNLFRATLNKPETKRLTDQDLADLNDALA